VNKLSIPLLILVASCNVPKAQEYHLQRQELIDDVIHLLDQVATNYAYLSEKDVDMQCLRRIYTLKSQEVHSLESEIGFYEQLLNEFYDSHVHLNTNTQASYRLSAPLYVTLKGNTFFITQYWKSQLKEPVPMELIGAAVLTMNGQPMNSLIDAFPCHCNNKVNPVVREWIANKIIAGKYNQRRMLKLRLENGDIMNLDVDGLKIRTDEGLLKVSQQSGIGIIRLNNTLGDNQLISALDQALDTLYNSKGLVLDLRNTPSGGNTYVARGILGHFVKLPTPYQMHSRMESYGAGPAIPRTWVEYVEPRGLFYDRPVTVLVGRWTGSMGEGLAVGFDALDHATVIGTEMQRLAGAITTYAFRHRDYGFSLSAERLFHVNGTPREYYVPKYMVQDNIHGDAYMDKAFELLHP